MLQIENIKPVRNSLVHDHWEGSQVHSYLLSAAKCINFSTQVGQILPDPLF